jgi:hypothetical protein
LGSYYNSEDAISKQILVKPDRIKLKTTLRHLIQPVMKKRDCISPLKAPCAGLHPQLRQNGTEPESTKAEGPLGENREKLLPP